MSSNAALQKVRWLFNANKGGHTGSLDPLATGVLPLCLGEATKFSQYLLDADKAYVTEARLGMTTATGDAEGDVLEIKPVNVTLADVEALLPRFTGEIDQVPPMYSALKHEGQPLYKLARAGETIERKARTITISQLKVLGLEGDRLQLEVHCSKGTYIRSLVEDIGAALGCGAHVSALRRIKAGNNVWYSPDQDFGRDVSVFAPFFGINAATIKLTAKIARMTGAPVMPLIFHRNPDNRTYTLEYLPALEHFPSGDEVADAAQVNAVIEAAIRRHPEQYLWLHRRFKTRPQGEPGFY